MVDEVEAKHFRFRELTKVKVSKPFLSANERCSLLCVSNTFGLTFIGCNQGVQVFETQILYAISKDEALKDNADLTCLKATLIPTPAPPLDVSLSCDSLTLSVCLKEAGKLRCLFFDTRLLSSKAASKTPFCTITLTTETGVLLSGLHWNPGVGHLLVLCLSNGSLHLLKVKEDISVVCSKSGLQANAVCWSPKGKQIAVGLKDGCVLQVAVKQNAFEDKKHYPCPDIFRGVPMQVSDLYWVSTYNFALVYTPQSGSDKTPNSVFLTGSKAGSPEFASADDVYYGGGNKKNKFHFSFLSKWGVLISSSSNALDTAVFGQTSGQSEAWQKYELEDTGRAEFPLDKKTDAETFAAGMALDMTSQEEVVITVDVTFPPSPLLLLLSDHGILSPFTVINTDCPSADLREMMSPPKQLPSAPIRVAKGSVSQAPAKSTTAAMPTAVAVPKSTVAVLKATVAMPIITAAGGAPTISGRGMTFPAPPPPGATPTPGVQGSSGQSLFGGPRPTAPLAGVGAKGTQGMPTTIFGQAPPMFGAPTLPLVPSPTFSQLFGTSVWPPAGGTGPRPPVAGGTGIRPLPAYPFSSVGAQQPQPHFSTKPLGDLGGGLSATAGHSVLGGPVGSSTPLVPSGHTSKQPTVAQQPRPLVGVASTQPGVQQGGLVLAAETRSGRGAVGSGVSSSKPALPLGSQQLSSQVTSTRPPTAIPTQPLMGAPSQPPQVRPPTAVSTPRPPSQPPQGAATRPPQVAPTRPPQGAPSQPPQGAATRPPQAAPTRPPQGALSQPPQAAPTQPPQVAPTWPPQVAPTWPPQVAPTRPPQGALSQPPQVRPPMAVSTPQPPPQVAPTQPPTAVLTQPPQLASSRPPPLQYIPPTHHSPQKPPAQPPSGKSQHGQVADASLNQEHVDSNLASAIRDMAEKFSEEIDELKKSMCEVYGDWEGVSRAQMEVKGLGKLPDLSRIHEEVLEVKAKVDDSTKQFKKVNQSCELLGEDTLKGYEILEQTRAEINKRKDPNYTSLQRLRPLDVESAERLTCVRAKFLQVQQSLQGITSQLESRLEAIYEERRQKGRDPLKAPSLHVVYSTLKDHHRITRLQNVEVERVIRHMKDLRLIPRCWEPADFSTPRGSRVALSPTSSSSTRSTVTPPPSSPRTPPDHHMRRKEQLDVSRTRGAERGGRRQDSSQVTPQQMSKLREYFGNITVSPVRQVNTAPKVQLSPTEFASRHSSSAHPSSSLQSSYIEQTDYGSATNMLPPSTAAAGIGLAPGIGLSHPPAAGGGQHPLLVPAQPTVDRRQHAQTMELRMVPPSSLLSKNSSLSASQSSISTQLSSQSHDDSYYEGEPDVTLTAEREILSPHQPKAPQPRSSSKYDVLLSPDGEMVVNTSSGQETVSLDTPTTLPASSKVPQLQSHPGGPQLQTHSVQGPAGPQLRGPGVASGGTVHHKPQVSQVSVNPALSQVTQSAGGGLVYPNPLGSTFPTITAIQLPPLGQPQPGHGPPGKFTLPGKPPPIVYTSKSSDGSTILHGSLPQLSSLPPSAPGGGLGGVQGELRKTLGHNNLSLIGPTGGDADGGFRLLSSTSSASVPNVNAADSAEPDPGVGVVPVSRLQSVPTTTTASSSDPPSSGATKSTAVTKVPPSAMTRLQSTPTLGSSRTTSEMERLLSVPVNPAAATSTTTPVLTSSVTAASSTGGLLKGFTMPNLFSAPPAATAASSSKSTSTMGLSKALTVPNLFGAPTAATSSPFSFSLPTANPFVPPTAASLLNPSSSSAFPLSTSLVPPSTTATQSSLATTFNFGGGSSTATPFPFTMGGGNIFGLKSTASAPPPPSSAVTIVTAVTPSLFGSGGSSFKLSLSGDSARISLPSAPVVKEAANVSTVADLKAPTSTFTASTLAGVISLPTGSGLSLGVLASKDSRKVGVASKDTPSKTREDDDGYDEGGPGSSDDLGRADATSTDSLGGSKSVVSSRGSVDEELTTGGSERELSTSSATTRAQTKDSCSGPVKDADTSVPGGSATDVTVTSLPSAPLTTTHPPTPRPPPSEEKPTPPASVAPPTSASGAPPHPSSGAPPPPPASSGAPPPPPASSGAPPPASSGAPPPASSGAPPPASSGAPPPASSGAPPPPPASSGAPPPPPASSGAPPPPPASSGAPPPASSGVPPPASSGATPPASSGVPPLSSGAPPPSSGVPPPASSEAPPTTSSSAPPSTSSGAPPTTSSGAPPSTSSGAPPPPALFSISKPPTSMQPLQPPALSIPPSTATTTTQAGGQLGSASAVEESEMGDDMDFGSCEPSGAGAGGGGGLSLGGMGLGGQPTANPTANPFGAGLGTPSRPPAAGARSGGLFRQPVLGNLSASPGISPSATPQAGGMMSGGQGTGRGSGFGAAPSFGSPPSFGSGPAFGGGSTFGSVAGFGSSPPFGGNSLQTAPMFGTGGTGSSGSGGGAELSFGNLAQNQSNDFAGSNSGGIGVGNSSMSGTAFRSWR